MQIAIAQINTTVGDLQGNYEKIIKSIHKAKEQGVDLLIFPELTITGYPPKDLVLKPSFIKKNKEILDNIMGESKGIGLFVGFIDKIEGDLYNSAAFINNGKILKVYHKMHLPNYDVFDEKRYFKPGDKAELIEFKGIKIGFNVCEDIWIDDGPVDKQCNLGADLIINLSASPFYSGKVKVREELLARRALENKTPIIYANLVGGQDDLVFDGRSYMFNENGKILAKMESFGEDFLILPEFDSDIIEPEENILEDIYKALILGLRDYVWKNGFSKVVVGLSGGIDSALTAAIAVKALGKENVLGIAMPSKFSSQGSIDDSKKLASNLGIQFEIIPIKNLFDSYVETMHPLFKDTEFNVTEENVQARTRGNILMAMSNKFGNLVLTTGNKSESSVGYATLYGDMAGGLAVISDVFKTQVYELSKYINEKEEKEIIPNEILVKAPSAELRDGQKDSDSLPEYHELDPILKLYVEEDKSMEEIIEMGFDKETVVKVIRMVDKSEFKRFQAAPGIKITPRAFGSGRRMPLTNRWNEE